MARVPYLTPETATGYAAELLTGMRSRGRHMHIVEAVAHSSGGIRNFVRLANSLIEYLSIAGKLREIAIMRLAERLNSEYEWVQHEPYARREGVSEAQLAALKEGRLTGVFNETELAVLRFVDEAQSLRLSDEAWARIESELGREAAVDLVLVVAWWGGMTPRIAEALQLEPE